MKYIPAILIFVTFSCSHESSSFIQKDHEVIKSEIKVNYEKKKQIFQSLANEVAYFKKLRAIQFKYGQNGLEGIQVYCDSLNRNANGYSFVIENLNDSRLQKVLSQEGITNASIENIKSRLDQINCNSFFTFRQININTGTPYIHVEFKYNDWNGANFYFYKLFDKKMEANMVNFFDRTKVQMGQIKNIGGLLDSNVVWYLPYD